MRGCGERFDARVRGEVWGRGDVGDVRRSWASR